MSNIEQVLKDAMKGELDSVTVYKNAAENAEDEEVKKFFENRIKEEETHYNSLLVYFQAVTQGDEIRELELENSANTIFTEEFKERIGSKQVLFSAVSVATLLEKSAFEFYQKAAKSTDDKVLKDFFLKMVNWEKQHYDELLEIADAAEKYFWQINRFEPF